MIQPDARSRLTPQDIALVFQCTGAEPFADGPDVMLPAEDMDAALDRPELVDGLRATPPPGPSLSLFFYVMVRHALVARGITDRRMADYCAALLREFGRGDRAHRVAAVDDHRHQYLVDIVADATTATAERRFMVQVHLGNYALWLAGIFPERIEARRSRKGGPDLAYYDALGGRGFALASDHWLADRVGISDVLRTAAGRFTALRGALNAVSSDLRRLAA